MGAVFVQASKNTNVSLGATITSMTNNWTSATGAGNFLYAALATCGAPGSITPPAGWTWLGNVTYSNGARCDVAAFLASSASSQSNAAQTWNWANGVFASAITYLEFSGIAWNATSDYGAAPNQASGNSASMSGGSLLTTNANDLLIGAFAQGDTATSPVPTFSGPNSPWILDTNATTGIVNSLNPDKGRIGVGVTYLIANAINTYTPTLGSNTSTTWTGITFAWQATPVTFDPSVNAGWMGQEIPRPRPVYFLPPHKGVISEAGPAYFLNDPSKLDPSATPSWIGDTGERPRSGRKLINHEPFADPTEGWLVQPGPLPAFQNRIDDGLLPRKRAALPRDEIDPQPDQTSFSILPTIPAPTQALQDVDHLPKRRPRVRMEPNHADPTNGGLLPPTPYSPALSSTTQGPPQQPVRVRHLFVSAEQYPLPIPDIVAVANPVYFDLQAPRRPARLSIPSETIDSLVLAFVAQAQPWDVQGQTPRISAKLTVRSGHTAEPVAVPVDDLGGLSGVRQDMAYMPRRLARADVREFTAFAFPPVSYDPFSTMAALSFDTSLPRRARTLFRSTDVDATAAFNTALVLIANVQPAAWADVSPTLPRRVAKGQPGDFCFVLDLTQIGAPVVPLQDMPQTPRAVKRLWKLPEESFPPQIVSVTIIVPGPYWAVAQSIWVSGAVAGQMGTE